MWFYGTFVSITLSCVFFNAAATTEIYTYGHTLPLHDAFPIFVRAGVVQVLALEQDACAADVVRQPRSLVGRTGPADVVRQVCLEGFDERRIHEIGRAHV